MKQATKSAPAPTLTRPARAAIYVRISQDREGAGLGVARQEEDCRALCQRKGWDVAGIYPDNDVSAYSGKPRKHWRQGQRQHRAARQVAAQRKSARVGQRGYGYADGKVTVPAGTGPTRRIS